MTPHGAAALPDPGRAAHATTRLRGLTTRESAALSAPQRRGLLKRPA